MLAPMLLLALTQPARAECLPVYEDALRRNVVTMATASGLWGFAMAGAAMTIFNPVYSGRDPGLDEAGYISLIGVTVASVATMPMSTATPLLLRRNTQLLRLQRLVEDAQMGDGPALRAYAADLEAELGRPVPVADLAQILRALDNAGAFCEDRSPDGLRRADERVKAGLMGLESAGL